MGEGGGGGGAKDYVGAPLLRTLEAQGFFNTLMLSEPQFEADTSKRETN